MLYEAPPPKQTHSKEHTPLKVQWITAHVSQASACHAHHSALIASKYHSYHPHSYIIIILYYILLYIHIPW